jgi:hypothetical protein
MTHEEYFSQFTDDHLITPNFPVPLTQKVEEVVSNLPSEYLIDDAINYVKRYTPKKYQELAIRHLLIEWEIERDQNKFLGKCLKAAFGGGGGNPALEAKTSGEISEADYKVIYAVVRREVAMFDWIQTGWPYIKAKLEEVFIEHPQSETEFFFEVVKEAMDGIFRSCIHKKTVSIAELEKHYRNLKDLRWSPPSKNSWIDEKKSKELAPSFKKVIDADGVGELPLFSIAMETCDIAAKTDEPLQRALRDWSLKSSELYALLEEYLRKARKSKTIKSERWINGIKHEGTKGGYRIVTNL